VPLLLQSMSMSNTIFEMTFIHVTICVPNTKISHFRTTFQLHTHTYAHPPHLPTSNLQNTYPESCIKKKDWRNVIIFNPPQYITQLNVYTCWNMEKGKE
jgi:hypothetical protein